jgi:hypothetical protein
MLRAALAVSCPYLFGPEANILCTINGAHEPQRYLKSQQSLGHSSITSHFMEPEGSLRIHKKPLNWPLS